MLGTLTIYAHFQRDGNDTDTLIARFDRVNIISDGQHTHWTATAADGRVVARMQTFEDWPVGFLDTAIEIGGILIEPHGVPAVGHDHYGHWQIELAGPAEPPT